MINSIIIKDNNAVETKIKNITEDNIHKKCSYKNDNNFCKLKTWETDSDNATIELWGKNKQSNFCNKSEYELFSEDNLNVDVYGKSIFIIA